MLEKNGKGRGRFGLGTSFRGLLGKGVRFASLEQPEPSSRGEWQAIHGSIGPASRRSPRCEGSPLAVSKPGNWEGGGVPLPEGTQAESGVRTGLAIRLHTETHVYWLEQEAFQIR